MRRRWPSSVNCRGAVAAAGTAEPGGGQPGAAGGSGRKVADPRIESVSGSIYSDTASSPARAGGRMRDANLRPSRTRWESEDRARPSGCARWIRGHSGAHSRVFRLAGPAENYATSMNYFLVSLTSTVLAAVVGGYITALIAGSHEFPYAAGLGFLMIAMSIVSMRQAGASRPGWYETSVAGCGPLSAMIGAAFRLLTKRGPSHNPQRGSRSDVRRAEDCRAQAEFICPESSEGRGACISFGNDIFMDTEVEMTAGNAAEPEVVHEYVFGDYRIDLGSYQLWRGEQPITLTPKNFDTLAVLIRHRDRAVSKEELLKSVWPDSSATEDSLTQSISVLRKALGDSPTHPVLIATIARRGYRFIAPVVQVPLDHPPADEDLKAVAPRPPSTSPEIFGMAPLPAVGGFRNWPPLLAGTLLGAGLILAIGMLKPEIFSLHRLVRQEPPPLRVSIGAPSGASHISGGVLSPDGRLMLLLAEDDRSGVGAIWIRSLTNGQSWPIAGTEGASRPFWSSDSRSIGFFAGGKLKRVGIDNQTPQAITEAGTNSAGGTWNSKGVILFAEVRSCIYSVSESGGAPVPVTTLNLQEQEIAHRWPQFLPDGDHFLFFIVSAKPNRSGTYLGSLSSRRVERLLNVPALFAQPGFLIYTRDRLLMAEPFNPARPHARQAPMAMNETAFPDGSIDEGTLSNANLSVSANGLLANTSSGGSPQVKWFDRSGRELAAIDTPTLVYDLAISPDQKQVLVGGRSLEHGVWLLDLSRGVSTRIVTDGMRSVWSPDGMRIAFSADRAGFSSFFIKPVTGPNSDALLLRSPHTQELNDWSPDGRYILYTSISPETKDDLWILPMFGDRQPRPFLQTPSNEAQGQISPDAHWVAYTSDESGIEEIYLQSFPEPGGKRILSVDGGVEPHWRADGRELFYLAPDRNLMAVSITLGPTPKIERPRVLFRAPVVLPVSNILNTQLAVSADGQRFLISSVERKTKGEQVTVLSSWPSLLSH